MLKNILGDKLATIIGLVIGTLGFVVDAGKSVIPGSVEHYLLIIVSIGSMLFGAVTTTKPAN